MGELYIEEAPNPMFLTGFFQAPAKNFFTSKTVEVDIDRDSEDVAIVVHDLAAGRRKNELTKYENKEFTPPVFDEEGDMSAYALLDRRAGNDPFAEIEYGIQAAEDAFRLFTRCQKKIGRAVELMAAQILTTGTVTCVDSAGVALYTIDYGMRAAHKIPVTWALDGSTGDPETDLYGAGKLMRANGKTNATKLVCGATALSKLLANAKISKKLVRDGFNLGQLMPSARGEGATFFGYVWIGMYRMEIWTYDGMYKDPVSGLMKFYVPENVIIMLPDKPRFDAKFGRIPLFKKPNGSGIPGLPQFPSRISSSDKVLDLTVNSWITEDGKHAMMSCGTRPLLIPTAIDQFVCITVS
jgi:hypothetical protein